MEYREGRCPKCNEVMQIPVGRDKIICMFCGQEFSIAESEEADAEVYLTELEHFSKNIDSVFCDVEKILKGFQRNEYEGSFERYLLDKQEFLRTISAILHAASDQKQAEQEIVGILLDSAGRAVEQQGKLARQSFQMSLNMYMVTYVLPAILSIENEKYSTLAQLICERWAVVFKNSNIQAAGYDTLKGGFRKKLCYITTAVCEGLHKSENCYELALLEQYRDGYLSSSEEGKALVEQYYDMAPTIVRRIGKREDHEQIYHSLYETYISPCVHLIEEQKNEECREKYQEMVEMLRAEYM